MYETVGVILNVWEWQKGAQAAKSLWGVDGGRQGRVVWGQQFNTEKRINNAGRMTSKLFSKSFFLNDNTFK